MDEFTALMARMLREEVNTLKAMSRKELFPAKGVKKTPFVVYLASYWLSVTSHAYLEISDVIECMCQILNTLTDFADSSK